MWIPTSAQRRLALDCGQALPEGHPRVAIVNGETGCGKSMQIPQLLYDAMCYRRVEPGSAAPEGDDGEGGDAPRSSTGGVVGFQIGGHRQRDHRTPISYFHERTTEYDLLLTLLLTRQTFDNATATRIVVMSATLHGVLRPLSAIHTPMVVCVAPEHEATCVCVFELTGPSEEQQETARLAEMTVGTRVRVRNNAAQQRRQSCTYDNVEVPGSERLPRWHETFAHGHPNRVTLLKRAGQLLSALDAWQQWRSEM
eukprot:gene19687-26796_t